MAASIPIKTLRTSRLINGISSLYAQNQKSTPLVQRNVNISPKEAQLSVSIIQKKYNLNAKTTATNHFYSNNLLLYKEPKTLTELLQSLSIEDKAIRLPESFTILPLVTPTLPLSSPLHLPQNSNNVAQTVEQLEDILPIYAPQHRSQSGITKHCIRAIVIRRKKMKKAKRKKERKRNKVSHEQRILRDILRRNEAFQAEQGALLHKAEVFDADKYVSEKLAEYNHRPIPKFFRGKRLPEAEMIKEFRKRGYKLPGED